MTWWRFIDFFLGISTIGIGCMIVTFGVVMIAKGIK